MGNVSALPVKAQSYFPGPDVSWAPEVAEAWHEFASSPLADPRILKSTDLPALRRLFSYQDRLVRAVAAFDLDPTATGSMGQEVLSPWAQEIHRLEAEIQRLEDRFGLTPLARLRLGVTFEEGIGLAQRNAQLLETFRQGSKAIPAP